LVDQHAKRSTSSLAYIGWRTTEYAIVCQICRRAGSTAKLRPSDRKLSNVSPVPAVKVITENKDHSDSGAAKPSIKPEMQMLGRHSARFFAEVSCVEVSRFQKSQAAQACRQEIQKRTVSQPCSLSVISTKLSTAQQARLVENTRFKIESRLLKVGITFTISVFSATSNS